MPFHGSPADPEPGGHLLILQPSHQQPHDREFPFRQPAGERLSAVGAREQVRQGNRRHDGAAGDDRAHRGDQLTTGSGLTEMPGRAGFQRLAHVLVIVVCRHHEHPVAGMILSDPAGGVDPVHAGKPDVHEDERGAQLLHEGESDLRRVRLANHRGREIEDLREQALGDAIAAETGTDDPQQRIAAAHLPAVHWVLFAEATRRILDGQPRDKICQVLAATARQAFDLLEPSLGGYGIKA